MNKKDDESQQWSILWLGWLLHFLGHFKGNNIALTHAQKGVHMKNKLYEFARNQKKTIN